MTQPGNETSISDQKPSRRSFASPLAKKSAAAPVTRPATRIMAPSTCTKSGKFQSSGRTVASTLMLRASRSCR